MAGRPKKMAERVTKLEERALALQLDVFRLTPRQYVERDDCGPDPLGLSRGWKNAWAAVTEAYLALEHLGDILRDKAVIAQGSSLAAVLTEISLGAASREQKSSQAITPATYFRN